MFDYGKTVETYSILWHFDLSISNARSKIIDLSIRNSPTRKNMCWLRPWCKNSSSYFLRYTSLIIRMSQDQIFFKLNFLTIRVLIQRAGSGFFKSGNPLKIAVDSDIGARNRVNSYQKVWSWTSRKTPKLIAFLVVSSYQTPNARKKLRNFNLNFLYNQKTCRSRPLWKISSLF